MKFNTIKGILKNYWDYGIFLAPLAPRFGGGWKGIIVAAVVRTSVSSIPYAIVLRAFRSEILFGWLLATSAIFLYSLTLEFCSNRQRRR